MMEHLRGSDVQVVLSLKEGKGFDRITNPTSIVATLNGQTLETGFIEPDAKPHYTTDLVWKAEKNILRKMRSGQEPLRIEWFEIKENERRDKIGHVLLSLRSARIILPRDGDIRVPSNWHKLLNLRSDLRAHKPEVSLALTIEEHEAYVRRISQKESSDTDKDRVQNNFAISRTKIANPYLVEEENLVQLGPVATCHSLFLLNIIAGTAKNLHLLRDQTQDGNGNYSLWYRVLENDVRLRSFSSLPDTWTLNEKVVIRLRSSLAVLRNYLLERPNFLLTLLYRDKEILGSSEIDLGALISANTTEFSLRNGENGDTLINNRCILSKRKTPRNIGDNEDNEAFVDLQLRLIYLGSSNFNEMPITEIPQPLGQRFDDSTILRESFSGIDAHRNPCGDFSRGIYNEHHENVNCKNLQIDLSNRDYLRNTVDRVPLPRSIITATNSRIQHSRSSDLHHCFCLNVNLDAIELSSSTSSMRNIEFRFHHPKADIASTTCPKMSISTNEKLRLQDIGCKLHFISTVDKISQLLRSFPPKISVTSTDPTECTTAQAILDVDKLFYNRENHDYKKEFRYEAPLYDSERKRTGTIDVAMNLEDRGSHNEKTQRDTENLGPPIMDESVAYQIVEELEIWKERQEEIFRVELRRKEEWHLNRLSDEWQKRRANLEAKLACSVEQCKILADSLNKATDDLRTRRLQSLEKEARLIKANEDLQWRYEKNMKEMQESSRRIQEELLSKVNILQEQKDLEESQIEPLRLENEKLRRLTSKQSEELQACQKGTLTRDQTASLLQEVKSLEQKLSNTQKSKSFFKEQWGMAVREIHRMKMEHQQTIESQIKTSKDELKNINVEDILGADSSALTNDQMMLSQIQKEIDIIRPRSAYVNTDQTSNRQLFIAPTDTLYSQRDCRNIGKPEENDERLRKLIEERDSLLKTGSYTIDDNIVVKLNTEIRSLLVSN